MNSDLRDRVAKAIALDVAGDDAYLNAYLSSADAVLAELAPLLNTPTAQPKGSILAVGAAAIAKAEVLAANKAAPQPQPQAAMLTNPYTGTPRDYRDVESDPAGVLIQEPGAPLRAAAPRPQASAEDVEAIDRCMANLGWECANYYRDAWQRIRASLGVGK